MLRSPRRRSPLPLPVRCRIPRASTALLAALLWLGCGAGDAPPPVESAPPEDERLAFQREGIPGPWWRTGASQATFDVEHRACLARSREARRRAADGDPADAAYRAFIECMQRQDWRRGLPPRS